MKNNTLAIALAALLVGGVAVAAFQHSRDNSADLANPNLPDTTDSTLAAGDVPALDSSIPAGSGLEYAQVVKVDPITEKRKLYAQVIGTEPVRETSTTSAPHEVCNDVVVQQQAPRADPHNIGGTVAGAVLGGLIGNQVGGGTGKKLATVGGAVGGGFAGRAIEQKHAENKTISTTERQCHTETSTSETSRTVAYNVTYRNPDGTTGTMRVGSKPGSRIALGSEDVPVAYNVTYSYDGQEHTIKMDDKPGERLPVVDGQVVTQVAAAAGDESTSRQ